MTGGMSPVSVASGRWIAKSSRASRRRRGMSNLFHRPRLAGPPGRTGQRHWRVPKDRCGSYGTATVLPEEGSNAPAVPGRALQPAGGSTDDVSHHGGGRPGARPQGDGSEEDCFMEHPDGAKGDDRSDALGHLPAWNLVEGLQNVDNLDHDEIDEQQ